MLLRTLLPTRSLARGCSFELPRPRGARGPHRFHVTMSTARSTDDGGAVAGLGRRVLSIQSHVVQGHVGNKSAVLPLQLLGIDVDAINSVQFSNHTGYKNGFRGEVLNGEQLWALVEGLEANDLLKGYTHLLTGYIGSESLARTILKVLAKLREHNPECAYVCDPVLGDHGRLYVPASLVDVFRTEVVQCASMLTPNEFEATKLTGLPISDVPSALAVCGRLHALGPHTVVITSLDCDAASDAAGRIMLVASTTLPQASGNPQRFIVTVPRREGYFTGTGDLLAALLLGWSTRHPDNLALATRMALCALQAVIMRTADSGHPTKELLLVQSVSDLLNPPELPPNKLTLTDVTGVSVTEP